jgi:hypothetical protein
MQGVGTASSPPILRPELAQNNNTMAPNNKKLILANPTLRTNIGRSALARAQDNAASGQLRLKCI